MGLKYPRWGLHWTSYWSCFICLWALTWKISAHAKLFSVTIIFVLTVFEVFESFSDLLLYWVCHQTAVWVPGITLPSSLFYSYFIPSCFQTISLFPESIPSANGQWLEFFSIDLFLILLIYNYIPVLIFQSTLYFGSKDLEFSYLSAGFDYLCFLNLLLFFHDFFFMLINLLKYF